MITLKIQAFPFVKWNPVILYSNSVKVISKRYLELVVVVVVIHEFPDLFASYVT